MERRSVLMSMLLMVPPLLAAQPGRPTGGKSMNDVRMVLALDAPPAQGQVRLRVELENHGTKRALVPRAVATMDRLLGNVFTVREGGDGTPVAYEGPMVKRGPLTAADYLALLPGQRHVHTIDIGPAYAFRPGTHTYEVSYAGHYLTDARALAGGGDPGVPLAAPPVTFTYTK